MILTQAPIHFNREEFLTPFDKVFDKVMETSFPQFTKDFGIKFFENSSYPKVDVIDYDDKVTIIAEIPNLNKDQLIVEVEDRILTICGSKHIPNEDKGKYIKRELKHSAFRRSFELGDKLSDQVEAMFDNGVLTVDIPKVKPKKPTKTKVKIL